MEAPASPLGELSEAAWTAIEESTAPAPEKIAALRSLIGNGAGQKSRPFAFARGSARRPFSPHPCPPAEDFSEDTVRIKELAVTRLTDLYVSTADVPALCGLLAGLLRPLFAAIPKARTARIVRSVIEALGRVPGSLDAQVALCTDTVEWCRREKRSFLRMRVQLRLAQLCVPPTLPPCPNAHTHTHAPCAAGG